MISYINNKKHWNDSVMCNTEKIVHIRYILQVSTPETCNYHHDAIDLMVITVEIALSWKY